MATQRGKTEEMITVSDLQEVKSLEGRFINSHAMMVNAKAVSSWQDIYPVGIFATKGLDRLKT